MALCRRFIRIVPSPKSLFAGRDIRHSNPFLITTSCIYLSPTSRRLTSASSDKKPNFTTPGSILPAAPAAPAGRPPPPPPPLSWKGWRKTMFKYCAGTMVVSLVINFGYAWYDPTFRVFMSSKHPWVIGSMCDLLFGKIDPELSKVDVEKLNRLAKENKVKLAPGTFASAK